MNTSDRIRKFMEWAPALISTNEKLMEFLCNEGFFVAPASTRWHGAYSGGLFDHSALVYRNLQNMTNKLGLEWQRPESPFIVGMFHDMCKYDSYIKKNGVKVELANNQSIEIPDPENEFFEWNNDTLLKGHGAKSVMIISRFFTLTEEELLCIRYHMGAYEKDEWEEYGKSIEKYPNVLYTHTADMIATRVDGV